MQQSRVETPELLRIAKDQVHGPFALKRGPVIVGGERSKDFCVQGIEPQGQTAQ